MLGQDVEDLNQLVILQAIAFHNLNVRFKTLEGFPRIPQNKINLGQVKIVGLVFRFQVVGKIEALLCLVVQIQFFITGPQRAPQPRVSLPVLDRLTVIVNRVFLIILQLVGLPYSVPSSEVSLINLQPLEVALDGMPRLLQLQILMPQQGVRRAIQPVYIHGLFEIHRSVLVVVVERIEVPQDAAGLGLVFGHIAQMDRQFRNFFVIFSNEQNVGVYFQPCYVERVYSQYVLVNLDGHVIIFDQIQNESYVVQQVNGLGEDLEELDVELDCELVEGGLQLHLVCQVVQEVELAEPLLGNLVDHHNYLVLLNFLKAVQNLKPTLLEVNVFVQARQEAVDRI